MPPSTKKSKSKTSFTDFLLFQNSKFNTSDKAKKLTRRKTARGSKKKALVKEITKPARNLDHVLDIFFPHIKTINSKNFSIHEDLLAYWKKKFVAEEQKIFTAFKNKSNKQGVNRLIERLEKQIYFHPLIENIQAGTKKAKRETVSRLYPRTFAVKLSTAALAVLILSVLIVQFSAPVSSAIVSGLDNFLLAPYRKISAKAYQAESEKFPVKTIAHIPENFIPTPPDAKSKQRYIQNNRIKLSGQEEKILKVSRTELIRQVAGASEARYGPEGRVLLNLPASDDKNEVSKIGVLAALAAKQKEISWSWHYRFLNWFSR